MTPYLILAAALGIAAAWLIRAALTAPDGWQDADGWHEGSEPLDDARPILAVRRA
jgi:hypothetical protein